MTLYHLLSIIAFGFICVSLAGLVWCGGLVYINYWDSFCLWLKPGKEQTLYSYLNELSLSNMYWQYSIGVPPIVNIKESATEAEKEAYIKMVVGCFK